MRIAKTIFVPTYCLLLMFDASASGSDLSLTDEPFIHPKVIESLVSHMSESPDTDQIVAVDVNGSQKSNRFCCEPYKVHEITNQYPFVSYSAQSEKKGEESWFGYQFVGRTESGVIVLLTSSGDSGSGRWKGLLFLVVDEDLGIVVDADTIRLGRKRLLLKTLGSYFLGDRWKGKLQVDGNRLFIGKDHGWFSVDISYEQAVDRANDWAEILTIQSDHESVIGPD